MSRARRPTDNAAMETINGWVKEEMFAVFRADGGGGDVPALVERYVRFFNEGRPSYALGHMTPAAFTTAYAGKEGQLKQPSRSPTRRKSPSWRGRKPTRSVH